MNKFIKKIFCCIFIYSLILSYFVPVITFANTKNFKSYLALGDSIAYGYGLSNKEIDSYPVKVREKCGISTSNFNNLSISGMKCSEFYEYIKTDNITEAIKNTELITVSIGSNELLGIITDAIREVTGVTVGEDEDFIEKVMEKINSASRLEQGQMLINFYNKLTSEETKVKIENAATIYQETWIKSVKYIKEINPDVSIVATEFYNPYYEFAVLSYDVGGFVDEYIQKFNKILWENSDSQKKYKIAKIYEAFNTTEPRLTNVNSDSSNINVDPHPNVLGHDLISVKVLDALSTIKEDKIDISTLTISDIQDFTYTGEEIKPTLIVKNGDLQLVQNVDYTISYNNNINVGEAQIILVGIDNYEGTVIKTFNIKSEEPKQKEIPSLTVNSIENQVYTGIKISPDVEILDDSKKLVKDIDYKLDYQNNINVGQAVVIITGIGNYTGTTELSFEIVPKSVSTVVIKDISDQIATGEEIIPELDIYNGSAKLQKDKDYTTQYSNNVNEGQANVVISGIGNYTGTINKQFNIITNNEIQLKDIAQLDITSIEDKIYTGKLITPEVRIKDGDTVLLKNIDYLINYSNNENIGIGKAIIVGIGNYTGKIEKEFNIVRKNIDNTLIEDISDQIYNGKELTPELIITSDNIKLEKGKDYTIKYENNINEGTATIVINGIGNYTGNTAKTFNIIKSTLNTPETENNNKDDGKQEQITDKNQSLPDNPKQEDTTLANKDLPLTGKKAIICLFVTILMASSITFIKYQKYNNIDK